MFAFRHFAQTLTRIGVPPVTVFTDTRFGLKLRLVRGARVAHWPECTCRIFWPLIALFAQTEQIFAITETSPYVSLYNTLPSAASERCLEIAVSYAARTEHNEKPGMTGLAVQYTIR